MGVSIPPQAPPPDLPCRIRDGNSNNSTLRRRGWMVATAPANRAGWLRVAGFCSLLGQLQQHLVYNNCT